MQQSCQKSPSGDLGVEELRFKFNTMRQYPLFFILIGLSCILSSSSCDKEDKTKNCCNCTAPETQTGAGTLSFELNGKVWSPCGDGDNKVYASSYLNNGVPKIKIYKTERAYKHKNWEKIRLKKLGYSRKYYASHATEHANRVKAWEKNSQKLIRRTD